MTDSNRITLAHGSGGRAARAFLNEVVFPTIGVRPGDGELDAAPIPNSSEGNLAFTTDGFVVQPLDFPGGTIGKLAACGTLNDLAVSGARPLCLSCSLILEEGLPILDLKRYLSDLRREVESVGARVTTGDTKVVRKGEADGLYITTAGVGAICQEWHLSPQSVDDGDVILVSGTLGDHGAAVLSARESWSIEGKFTSDCKALWPLVDRFAAVCGWHSFYCGIRRGADWQQFCMS